ncbi:MAG TPA: MarR family transcriptional regulator [Ktedonobacterales bacterium]|nr:MarR family transcriptional regulator [Ktedonobacterales bacterium]
MSSASQDERARIHAEFSREMRQFTEINASFFRVAATRLGIAVTDMQVLDLLDLIGPATAGQLAELTGLTTGAITRILDRLEEARLVRRERDQRDGRKVIVRLASDQDDLRKVRSILDAALSTWEEVASHYDQEQLAFLVAFLQHSTARSRQALARLQEETPSGKVGGFSAPLGDVERGRLVVSSTIARLTVRADEGGTELYQARFEGPVPNVKTKEGTVTIRYPRRMLGLGGKQGAAEIALSSAIPWQIVIQGGAEEVVADVGGLALAALEVKGGFSQVHLELPAPVGVVPIRILGGAPEITVRRPSGVPAQVHLKGWVSTLVFDEHTFSGVGNNAQLQSAGFDPAAPRFDLEVASYASRFTITTR